MNKKSFYYTLPLRVRVTRNELPVATGNPIEQFLKWYKQQSREHQLELAEFIGHFCYSTLYSSFYTDTAKIFALTEYLNSNKNNVSSRFKLLRLIDEIIEFIIEVNNASENIFFSREELIDELQDITSLCSIINELPVRNRRWRFTYLQWKRFRAQFPALCHYPIRSKKNKDQDEVSDIIFQPSI